ncbi:hypothetical protein [Ruegeria sp.]|uniref:hypothetical protein n=1 Tax=Ruegeria sp. TaxID=1879320 RepID=UPI0023239930|nr:hypothetical protein [Ruegeria sp.]MDA7964292.1 hypothetical protein [Ruegeria sp.]
MVQNNKVLTVSYGTFSCTLEGFDDSFETMKAIAEYFRDLAADDRYFGSEPPQPDAEMLTRIAQRDIARKVEASQSDSGLLLRATDDAPSVAAAPVASAPVQTPPPAPAAQPAPVQTPAPEGAADSIAAKLQRIRAVVSHSNESGTQYGEDVDTGYIEPAKAPVDAISAAFAAGALSPEDLSEEEPQAEPVAPPQAEAPEPEAVHEEVTAFEPEIEAEPAHIEPVELDEDAVTIESAFEQDADTLDEILALTGDHAIAPEESQDDQPEITSDDVLFTDEEEVGSDVDDILNLLDEDDEAPTETPFEEPAQNVLSAEDEADLLEEISLVEAELTSRTESAEPDDSDLDQDVSRLMDEADAHMDDPEASDQRETYSHLRTAVAAAEAEKAAHADGPAEDAEYRGDLASVVSPRRPEVNVTSMRPRADTAAPLKLVAEQRIDTDETETGPVTPRRIQSDQDTAPEESGFANFAQEQGAQSLSDLLEAAASYLSFIEGQEQFSRPQLMNKVRSLKQDEFNREESLRSFGQLLRDGKIEKAGGGRFIASTQIGFRPDDKRAAG